MSVRRIKTPQLPGRRCAWCEQPPKHRGFMWGKCACDDHLPQLTAWDKREQQQDYSDAQFHAGY